jgi:hypothetical protein
MEISTKLMKLWRVVTSQYDFMIKYYLLDADFQDTIIKIEIIEESKINIQHLIQTT